MKKKLYFESPKLYFESPFIVSSLLRQINFIHVVQDFHVNESVPITIISYKKIFNFHF